MAEQVGDDCQSILQRFKALIEGKEIELVYVSFHAEYAMGVVSGYTYPLSGAYRDDPFGDPVVRGNEDLQPYTDEMWELFKSTANHFLGEGWDDVAFTKESIFGDIIYKAPNDKNPNGIVIFEHSIAEWVSMPDEYIK
tara:strand:+ start:2181 stop:2594 length:414 start_codon:yes stop_codon:yes gene_type:complete